MPQWPAHAAAVRLRQLHPLHCRWPTRRAVAITAPTGIAATHISGTTIHAAFGVGVPWHVSDFERRMRGNPTRAKAVAQHLEVRPGPPDEAYMLSLTLRTHSAWQQYSLLVCTAHLTRAKVLLVDEVSMLAAEFLDLLDEQLRALVSIWGRGLAATGKGEKPAKLPAFGGVQLVACGDFFQLPPIPSRVPRQTWPRLRPEDVKQGRAVLYSGLDRSKREELFLNRGFAFQVRPSMCVCTCSATVLQWSCRATVLLQCTRGAPPPPPPPPPSGSPVGLPRGELALTTS